MNNQVEVKKISGTRSKDSYIVVKETSDYVVAIRMLEVVAVRVRVVSKTNNLSVAALREELSLPSLEAKSAHHASTVVALPPVRDAEFARYVPGRVLRIAVMLAGVPNNLITFVSNRIGGFDGDSDKVVEQIVDDFSIKYIGLQQSVLAKIKNDLPEGHRDLAEKFAVKVAEISQSMEAELAKAAVQADEQIKSVLSAASEQFVEEPTKDDYPLGEAGSEDENDAESGH